ncbi:MAG: flagellar hook-associated protein FlgK [Granulosicoccus sp.]
MTDILNTGKSALFAFQRALSTTSNNIANVDTEGYSRQRVDLEAVSGDRLTHIEVGRGVRIANIERIHDQFATAQVNHATSSFAHQDTHHLMASRIDNLMADPALSVSPAVTDFFNALQDANNDPSSLAYRTVVLDSADKLAQRFQTMQTQLDSAQTEVNDRTRDAVSQVSSLAKNIADINHRIITVNGSNTVRASNELKDQRDQLIKELSSLIDVDTVEDDSGALNVFIGKGISLVVAGRAQELSAVKDDIYPDRLKIEIGDDNLKQNISPRLQGGEIGGLNEFSVTTLHPAMSEIGRLAVVFADQLNTQHAKGLDLNGDAGDILFTEPLPQAFSSDRNTGTGSIDVTIDDTSLLKASDYLLRFDGTNLTAIRSSDGVESSGPLPFTLDGMTVNIIGAPAAGDTYVLSPTGRASGSFSSALNDPNKLALGGLLSTTTAIANLGESKVSEATILDHSAVSLNDPVDLVFTSDSTFDVVDVNSGATIVAGAAYTEGTLVQINGWQVSLDGKALTGDTHRIEPNTQGRGNNSNGQSLNDLQLALTVEGNSTFNDAYGALVSSVGASTRTAETRSSALESLLDSAVERQQSAQGVNLDEEAVNLTRYQQAYQASAKIIATADTLFQSILGAVR